MELSDLEKGLSCVASSGHSLNRLELIGVEAALSTLQRQEGLSNINFWGKIFGSSADYYIAYTLSGPSADYPTKDFFFAGEDFRFQPLPKISAQTASRILALGLSSTPLTGVPDRALEAATEAAEGAEAAVAGAEGGGEIEVEADPGDKLTESQQLAQAVQEIDFDTAVVPKGTYMLNEANAVVMNTDFKGLSQATATSPSSYMHFRPPASIAALRALSRSDAEYFSSFLDPLDSDLPRGCWAIREDVTVGLVTLRSLLWPGYSAFHIPGSTKYGGVYFGYAQKNRDLPFLM